MIWTVIWVVLMMFWLFGGGYGAYENNAFNAQRFGSYTLIPFLCVLLLGLIVLGGLPGR